MDLEHLLDGTVDIVLARRFAVERLDRERSTWNGERRSVSVEVRELKQNERSCC
jgi:hypothetical protein